jgi:hypothetical protein
MEPRLLELATPSPLQSCIRLIRGDAEILAISNGYLRVGGLKYLNLACGQHICPCDTRGYRVGGSTPSLQSTEGSSLNMPNTRHFAYSATRMAHVGLFPSKPNVSHCRDSNCWFCYRHSRNTLHPRGVQKIVRQPPCPISSIRTCLYHFG